MGGSTSGQALKGPGRAAVSPLLPNAARPLAVATAAACVLVVAVQVIWIRHGMETGWADTTIDAKVLASLGGHHLLVAALVWPGEPLPVTAMAAVVVLACAARRRYGEAALVAISVPLATAITELVVKPVFGRTSWGDPFPSGHVTSAVALATAVAVLLARTPAGRRRPLRLVLPFAVFLIAAAVAAGVIGAQMHHFSDTVGGTAVGIGTVMVTALALDLLGRWHSRHRGEVAGAEALRQTRLRR
jgi:membrane-associated phospholipid phosphatase